MVTTTSGATPVHVRTRGKAPIRKVTAVALAGAITTIIVFVLNSYVLPETKPLTADIASAITTVIIFAVAYFTPLDGDEVEVV